MKFLDTGKRELARKLTACINLNKAAQDEMKKWMDGFVLACAYMRIAIESAKKVIGDHITGELTFFIEQEQFLNSLEESTKQMVEAKVKELENGKDNA